MLPTSAPFPWGARQTPAGPGGGGKICSGAWKHGPESPIGVISLWFAIMIGCIPTPSLKSINNDIENIYLDQ